MSFDEGCVPFCGKNHRFKPMKTKADTGEPVGCEIQFAMLFSEMDTISNIITNLVQRSFVKGTEKYTGGNNYEPDRKSTRLNSSHSDRSRMPSSA